MSDIEQVELPDYQMSFLYDKPAGYLINKLYTSYDETRLAQLRWQRREKGGLTRDLRTEYDALCRTLDDHDHWGIG